MCGGGGGGSVAYGVTGEFRTGLDVRCSDLYDCWRDGWALKAWVGCPGESDRVGDPCAQGIL